MVMKSVRFRFACLFAGLTAISLAAPAPAQNQAPAANKPMEPSETKNFGDWTVRCYPPAAKVPCEMIELLVNKKTGRRVLGLLIVYNKEKDQHVMQIAMPLGVLVQTGAVLSTDTFTSPVLRYRLCDLQGCYAVTGLDDAAIKAFGRATKAEMQIVSAEGKRFKLGFSLNGFTAAHDALLQMMQKAPAQGG
jgi:invasion protein IalB